MKHINDTVLSATTVDREEGLIDFRRHLTLLLRRRWVIVASTAVALALTVLYLAVTPSQYTALSTVLIDPRQEQVVSANSVLPSIGTDSAAITSQVNVLESRGLLERVFKGQGLAGDPEFGQTGLLTELLASVQGRTVAVGEGAAFDAFRKRVSVQRLGLTYVLEIKFTSTDPVKAASLANAIGDAYLSELALHKSDANLSVTRDLDTRIATMRTALSRAELAVETFKVENSLLSGGGGTTVLQAQIDQMAMQLSAAREQARQADTRAEQARIALLGAKGANGLDDLLVSEAGSALRGQYNQHLTEISSLQASLGPRHPNLLTAQAELVRIESLIRAEAQRASDQLGADASLAKRNVESSEAELTRLATLLGENNRAEVSLRQLERDAEVARNLLEEFMRRSLETSELGTMQSSEARVLSTATEPRSATWPRANLLLALATALGFAIGCAIALVLGNAPPQFQAVGGPPSTPPAAPRLRAPASVRARKSWTPLGIFSPRANPHAVSSLADFVNAKRNNAKGFMAGISTVSSVNLQREMTYGLAKHLVAHSVSTVVVDLNPSTAVISRHAGTIAIELLSAFDTASGGTTKPLSGVPFVVVDDQKTDEPVSQNRFNALLQWAEARDAGIILVIMPAHETARWSRAVTARLDAEVLILRAEEVESGQVHILSGKRPRTDHPVAYLTVAAVPALVPNDNDRVRRRERAL